MKLVTWNVRGLNKLYKQKEMKEFIKENNIAIIAIVEHRVTELVAKKIKNKIAPQWNWCNNYGTGDRGRIWLLWDPNRVSFTVEVTHVQLIHGQVCILDSKMRFSFTTIYGLHTIGDQRSLWHELRQIENDQARPWLAMRDFNAVLNIEDRINGNQIQESEVKNFKDFMNDCHMAELRSIGAMYT
ncbi:uncharacterized protein LOC142164109 [Nicotiana tabacum]|uniref:Uncharacterized protein LOC142164109 n=1 Tax=Nicotiana tabacum TaxID=4097 RepID=A0AC58RXC3_TOBAC